VTTQYILGDVKVGEHERKQWASGSKDAEEVREILKAVSEFIEGLKEPIKEFLDMMLSSLDGKKLGEEVAKFYRELKESGMPEDMAKDMVKEFFKKRLESAPSLGSLIETLKQAMSKPHRRPDISMIMRGGIKDVKEIDEYIKLLEEVGKIRPEKEENIKRIISILKNIKERKEKEEEKKE